MLCRKDGYEAQSAEQNIVNLEIHNLTQLAIRETRSQIYITSKDKHIDRHQTRTNSNQQNNLLSYFQSRTSESYRFYNSNICPTVRYQIKLETKNIPREDKLHRRNFSKPRQMAFCKYLINMSTSIMHHRTQLLNYYFHVMQSVLY